MPAKEHLAARSILPRLGAATLLLSLLSPMASTAGDWVNFTDETATRIVAAPELALTDTEEKDFAIGDLDNDGDTDLLIVRKLPFTNVGPRRNVLFMNEDGVMTDRTDTLAPDMLDATDDRDVQVADFNGDGWLDVVVGTTLGEQPRLYMNRGAPLGSWLGLEWDDTRLPTFVPAPQFCAVAVGDLTGDDRPDLYFADYDNNLEDRLLINDGNGFFTDETDTRMAAGFADSTFGTDAEIFDMNGDGWNDIVKNNASGSSPPPGFSPNTSIMYNDGTGHFDVKDVVYDVAPYMTQVADFNQDDRMDLFIVDDGQDRVLTNTGNDGQNVAQFSTALVTTSPDTFGFGGNTWAADVDLDGILDIVVSDVDTDIFGCDRQLTILRGTGTPPNITYGDPLSGADRDWRTRGTFDAIVFDINSDGAPDLWLGTCEGTKVFMGDPGILPEVFASGFETGDVSEWSSSVGSN